MKDKLDDLIPWLKKLQHSLAKVNPDDDREEVGRRSQLARFIYCPAPLLRSKVTLDRSLEDIGKQSLALSEKGRVARVLDKTRDSQEVIKLVEKLRQAILEYQVSGRNHWNRKPLIRGVGITTAVDIQSGRPVGRESLHPVSEFETHRAVGLFKSSFDVLLKLHQVREWVRDPRHQIMCAQKTPIKHKIESVRARLDRFEVEGDAARNGDEFRRRKRLFEWVFLIRPEQPSPLTGNQNSRGDQG